MDGRSFLPVLKGEKQNSRQWVYTHINTLSSGRSYPMRSVQGKRYGLIWNGWSDGQTTFKNESMSGLTWKAMVRGAQDDSKLAARVKHYSYRQTFEFYDYQEDPDALHNLIDDPKMRETIRRHHDKLGQWMRATNDPQLDAYQKAITQQGAK